MTYKQLTLKYIEVVEEVQGTDSQIQELKGNGEMIPYHLRVENEHFVSIQMELLNEGLKYWGKKHIDMYKDGWDFWFEEDKQLREMRYGK